MFAFCDILWRFEKNVNLQWSTFFSHSCYVMIGINRIISSVHNSQWGLSHNSEHLFYTCKVVYGIASELFSLISGKLTESSLAFYFCVECPARSWPQLFLLPVSTFLPRFSKFLFCLFCAQFLGGRDCQVHSYTNILNIYD
jgi:hypothetical protein